MKATLVNELIKPRTNHNCIQPLIAFIPEVLPRVLEEIT